MELKNNKPFFDEFGFPLSLQEDCGVVVESLNISHLEYNYFSLVLKDMKYSKFTGKIYENISGNFKYIRLFFPEDYILDIDVSSFHKIN